MMDRTVELRRPIDNGDDWVCQLTPLITVKAGL